MTLYLGTNTTFSTNMLGQFHLHHPHLLAVRLVQTAPEEAHFRLEHRNVLETWSVFTLGFDVGFFLLSNLSAWTPVLIVFCEDHTMPSYP
jgi:hypothetical protein